MSNNPNNDFSRKKNTGLPGTVAQWYYKHGLFLSSYPTCASSIAVVIVLFSCYPLLNIYPLPGTIPTRVVLPYSEDIACNDNDLACDKNASLVKSIINMNNLTFNPPFPWAQSKPFVYVQQILLRSNVHPWTKDLRLSDAFRAPIYEVFKLLEVVRNHEDTDSKNALNNICLHVGNVKRTHLEHIFPEYNCLILSPANFWGQNVHNFNKDSNILNTIFQHHNLQKTKVSSAEMLFGLPMQDTGIKRYPLRARTRIIQYSITIVLRKNDQKVLESLKQKLKVLYPLHQGETSDKSPLKESVMYVYYPGEFKVLEFLPIIIAFVMLFMYIYFSVRKIEVVRSRIILALCAVLTALGSLTMSLGLCFFFGLTISSQSKGIFPYLVILVGLENSLVITKSVVTTDETFDVKVRVAQGLGKEGWSISKTLLTEITILTVGLATFVPVIQEFCVFAIVGLISDFFLQMLLFSTILALNIKRIEYTVEAKHLPKIMGNYYSANTLKRYQYKSCGNSPVARDNNKHQIKDSSNKLNDKKIPKRLKLVNFWTRTRLFQRAFMIWMIFWIFSIVYNSDIFEHFFAMDANTSNQYDVNKVVYKLPNIKSQEKLFDLNSTNSIQNEKTYENASTHLTKLRYPDIDLNYYLSNFHWSEILKQYNISVSGKYVMILPPIKLCYSIKPEVAILLRHPEEKPFQNFQWKALAAALDPLDLNDDGRRDSPILRPGGIPLYPKSPMEILLATILCAISVFVLTYTMIVFYRCICTRNYAEWRSSWNDSEVIQKSTQLVLESIPIQVKGHRHKIECLVSDGVIVVSTCLEGQIRVWDSKTGELISWIDRINYCNSIYTSTEPQNYGSDKIEISSAQLNMEIGFKFKQITSPVWCIDYHDNIVAVGCANGHLEFWEIPVNILKCVYEADLKEGQGVTNIHLHGNRAIIARLCGRLDFCRLETYYKGRQIDWGFTSAYRRTHVRSDSTGSMAKNHIFDPKECQRTKEEMKCTLEYTRLAHLQPITCMEILDGIVFTGGQDHTLKIYNLDDPAVDYSLHGHYGPITCLFVDHWQPGTGGSGSQDGLLCVWDLFTGACMYSIQAHDGSVTSLVCAPSYVISLGTDERLCVWEKFQGNLLNNINVTHSYSSLLMLTPSLLVTSKSGSLIVWDVTTGEPTREVKLDSNNSQHCPKVLLLASSSVICDYGNQLRIVRFPRVDDKSD